MTTPAEAFDAAKERHEAAGEHGPRWVPVAAAVLAVLAAVTTYLASARGSAALTAKDDAGVATTRAADSWNEYESRSIKEHVDLAAAATAADGIAAKLRADAGHEKAAAGPARERALGYEAQANAHDATSERLREGRDEIEIGATLFEVAIVLVSLTALAGTHLLPIVAGTAAALGLVTAVAGVLR